MIKLNLRVQSEFGPLSHSRDGTPSPCGTLCWLGVPGYLPEIQQATVYAAPPHYATPLSSEALKAHSGLTRGEGQGGKKRAVPAETGESGRFPPGEDSETGVTAGRSPA